MITFYMHSCSAFIYMAIACQGDMTTPPVVIESLSDGIFIA